MYYMGELVFMLSVSTFFVAVVKSCASSIGVPAIRFVEAITEDTRTEEAWFMGLHPTVRGLEHLYAGGSNLRFRLTPQRVHL